MTINDLLGDCITIQGKLIVTKYDFDNEKDIELYRGDAECVDEDYDCDDEDSFLDEDINFIYPDAHEPDTLHIELCID